MRRSSSTIIYDSANDLTKKELIINPVRAPAPAFDRLLRKYSLNIPIPNKSAQSSTSNNFKTLEKSQSCSKLTTCNKNALDALYITNLRLFNFLLNKF